MKQERHLQTKYGGTAKNSLFTLAMKVPLQLLIGAL
jgi:hypothetical protein